MADASPHADDDPVEELLARCLDRPDDEVDGAIDAACAAHPDHAAALRARAGFLRSTGMIGHEHVFGPDAEPQQLGPFRFVRRLGGGGMGVVHLAVQEPLGREVALKLIRPEHLFFPGAHERFQREIRIVAGLKHPGIVPVYTAGEENGVPYLAMEYVEGRTLADVIEDLRRRGVRPGAQDLLQAERHSWAEACCELVRQVAAALQHAHDHGVIHRDVKPSNILLTPDGRALLFDFGLAHREGSTQLTRPGAQPGSVAYMSPEQVRGESIDARTDVYSLGVTLYELLALQAPFTGGSLDDVRRRILDAAPTPLRDVDPALPRDAAVISATAMAPERGRRYPNAVAFGRDLAAFLERRPIAARPAGPLLRARRFTQRRPTLTVAAALGLLLLVGVPLALFLYERDARARIEREAEVARQVTAFLVDLFRETDPDRARGETVPVRVVLDRGVRRIRNELHEDPFVRAALLRAMGNAYESLGLFAEAEPLLREALALQEDHAADDELEAARCRRELGVVLRWRGELSEAVALHRQCLDEAREVLRDDDLRLAVFEQSLAGSLREIGATAEAQRRFESCVARARAAGPAGHVQLSRALRALASFDLGYAHFGRAAPVLEELVPLLDALHPGDHSDKVVALQMRAMLRNHRGDLEGAEADFAEALRMARALFDPDHPRIAEVQENWASTLTGRDDAERAAAMLEQALAQHRRTYPPNHPTLARALARRSRVLLDLGRIDAANEAANEAATIAAEVWPDGHESRVVLLAQRAWTACFRGEIELAVDSARQAVDMSNALERRRLSTHGTALRTLAFALATNGPSPEAERFASEAVRSLEEWFGAEHREVALARSTLAYVRLQNGNAVAALPEAESGLAIWERTVTAPHWGIAWARYLVGQAKLESGALEEAVALNRTSIEEYAATLGAGHPMGAFPRNNLGVALARLGRDDEAETWLAEALELRRALPPASDLLAISRINLAAVRKLRGDSEAAEELARACLEALPAGSRRAAACIELCAQLMRARKAEPTELRALAARARDLLPADHPIHAALDRRIRAGGR